MKVVVTNSINTPAVQLLMAIAMSVVVWLAITPIGDRQYLSWWVYLIYRRCRFAQQAGTLIDWYQSKLQKGIAAGESILPLLDEPEEKTLV